jgi:hypothetical protein
MIPRYTPNSSKAVEVILWLATALDGLDIYHLVKAVFFADKAHIAKYGRPICGDNYDAAAYGPLPEVVYGLLRFDPIEILATGGNGKLPFRVDDHYGVHADRAANMRKLSSSDIEALSFGLEHVRGRSFDDIFIETHEDPAYINASGRRMDYRDFIAIDDPLRAEKIIDIMETAEYVAS